MGNNYSDSPIMWIIKTIVDLLQKNMLSNGQNHLKTHLVLHGHDDLRSLHALLNIVALLSLGTQIPPKGLFGKSHRRTMPYIFTSVEIQQILKATKHLMPENSLRRITFRYLFTLLYVTGLRISEALNLSFDDVDIEHRILHIKQTKFNKSRLVPIDSSTAIALFDYCKQCEHHLSLSTSRTFFILDKGEPVKLRTAQYAFSKIRYLLNLGANLQGRVPRLYDLRHTFVCHRILAWYQQKIDVQQNLPYLSTYLSHVKVSDTYWYITGIPELMNVASTLYKSSIL